MVTQPKVDSHPKTGSSDHHRERRWLEAGMPPGGLLIHLPTRPRLSCARAPSSVVVQADRFRCPRLSRFLRQLPGATQAATSDRKDERHYPKFEHRPSVLWARFLQAHLSGKGGCFASPPDFLTLRVRYRFAGSPRFPSGVRFSLPL